MPGPDTLASLQLLKNVVVACALPPAPFLVLALAGGWVTRGRRRLGMALVACACTGVWLGACEGAALAVERAVLDEPPALGPAQRQALADAYAQGERAAIVVLGGGLREPAPEYGRPTPTAQALERLRYGAWLARGTGLPLAISGGTGWASPQRSVDGGSPPAEALVMGDIAADELGCRPRWLESGSRDTRENARRTLALLAPDGVQRVVVVTHAWHMPRALREFTAAAALASPPLRIVPAPLGSAGSTAAPALRWFPSAEGFFRMRAVLHEALAALAASTAIRP